MSRAAATSPRVEGTPPGWRRGVQGPWGFNRSGGTASGRTRARGKQCSPGSAVLDVFPRTRIHASTRSPKSVKGGNPRGGTILDDSPRRRQAAGARAAWSQPFHFSTARPHCSGDAGTPGATRRPRMPELMSPVLKTRGIPAVERGCAEDRPGNKSGPNACLLLPECRRSTFSLGQDYLKTSIKSLH